MQLSLHLLCAFVLAMVFPYLNGLWFKKIQTLANCDTVDALHFVSAFQKLRVNKTNEIILVFSAKVHLLQSKHLNYNFTARWWWHLNSTSWRVNIKIILLVYVQQWLSEYPEDFHKDFAQHLHSWWSTRKEMSLIRSKLQDASEHTARRITIVLDCC